jgi:PTS system mannose-specific IIA component
LLDAGHVEVIAGINLPMLIRLAGARKAMDVTAAVHAAQMAGRNYITIASELLGQDTAPVRAKA